MKQLFRVSVEGDIWVMAESAQAAVVVAREYVTQAANAFDLSCYPGLPKPGLVKMEALGSIPWNADDRRTVANLLVEFHQTNGKIER